MTVRNDIAKRIKQRVEAESKGTGAVAGVAQTVLEGLTKALESRNAPDCFRLPVDQEIDHADLRHPSIGLAPECKVKPRYRFLILKPQITFRSEADPDAIILLAVEEYSHQTFQILDTTAEDDVSKTVLHR
jgi:hypothetical protein